MEETPYVMNSLLCFLNSARSDYSYDSLMEVIFSFYSHEDIKVAKELVADLLKKDIVWRRDPDKKKKDLQDLLEFHELLKASDMNINIVTNSHKKMPPIGMEMLAPVLTVLVEEISKINETLPKIIDIKSEVSNTADTVRAMKIDIVDIRNKFKNAISGMQDATKDIVDTEVNVIEEIQSIRQSLAPNEVFPPITNNSNEAQATDSGNKSFAEITHQFIASEPLKNGKSRKGSRPRSFRNKVVDRRKGAISKIKKSAHTAQSDGHRFNFPSSDNIITDTEVSDQASSPSPQGGENPWILASTRNQRKRDHRATRREASRVTGSKTSGLRSFKAAQRIMDVFVGRVDNSVSEDDVKDYIKNIFNVDVKYVKKLIIKSDIYAAYKVGVSQSDREMLFDAERWPEGIIVNKFYGRPGSNSVGISHS